MCKSNFINFNIGILLLDMYQNAFLIKCSINGPCNLLYSIPYTYTIAVTTMKIVAACTTPSYLLILRSN